MWKNNSFPNSATKWKKIEVSECEFAQYQPRFDFYGIGERSVRKNIGKEMDKAIAIARELTSAK